MDTAIDGTTMQLPPMAALFGKMAKVMGLVSRIPKNGYNDHHKYKYASADDVADTIRDAMAESKLALFVDMGEPVQETFEYTDGYGKQKSTVRTTIRFAFTFACGDTGATRTSAWTGQVDDNSDKAVSKCATVAEKYFLMKTFVVSAGDEPDADADKHREEVGRKVTPKWFQEDRALHDLGERAFTAGLVKERNGKGVAEMEAMIAPKTWADYADRAAAAQAIKEIVEARRQAAAQSTSATEDTDSASQQPDKPAEPAITDSPGRIITATDSPFANPTTPQLDAKANGSGASVIASSNDDIPADPINPHFKKRPNGAAETMLPGIPAIGGD